MDSQCFTEEPQPKSLALLKSLGQIVTGTGLSCYIDPEAWGLQGQSVKATGGDFQEQKATLPQQAADVQFQDSRKRSRCAQQGPSPLQPFLFAHCCEGSYKRLADAHVRTQARHTCLRVCTPRAGCHTPGSRLATYTCTHTQASSTQRHRCTSQLAEHLQPCAVKWGTRRSNEPPPEAMC
ncbi:hypothetical protein TREES_T100000763 [Tupaia chinensis]|uniref:Uncharacterized protein n=1 Tax=Tupaia chinensis TaxID=246437 RepID=L9KII7_TUPCH|nr:hypothetical protein TREES_T100000763 [Tupaia chinensis]